MKSTDWYDTPTSVFHGSHNVGWSFMPCWVPTIVKCQRNHTEVYISYKLIGPFITYISPLFLSMLAMWLSTLFGEAVTSCFFCGCADYVLFPEFSCSHCPASTSCLVSLPILPAWLLANQCLFKIQVTGYRPLSHSSLLCKCTTFYFSISWLRLHLGCF